ncbi:MAG: nitrilase-related carbon-nitrogen hydrolase [Desulfobacterales bacterium]|nr:nitrilase-related carbon-nitrogen hydrolase [Desulfobacterales bacterium]
MQDIRIAVIISNARVGRTEENLSKISRWVEKAAAEGAAIVCFPEMQVTGYHIHADIKEFAQPVPGPASRYLEDLAREHSLTILAGLAETDAKGSIYAAQLVIGPEGLAGKYRKLHLGPPEKAVYTPDQDIPIFSAGDFRFGIQLCYDSHFPELATSMALKGGDAIFIPHASPGDKPDTKLSSWMRHLPARAFDNSIFIIACNQTGENGRGLSFPGAGVVIGPAGGVMESYAGAAEHMIVTDLKERDLSNVRGHRMRYFLPNRRPELYHL